MTHRHSVETSRIPACQVVVITEETRGSTHDAATIYNVAERLATLLDGSLAGAFDVSINYIAPLYFVPAQTLMATEAQAYGIVSEHQLFGGIAPYPFVATKAVSHAVINRTAVVPQGWSFALGSALAGQVLPGYTAFSPDDARRAGTALLAQGAVRIKSTRGIGGHGQHLVRDAGELATALDDYDESVLRDTGVVIEQHLEDVATYSVGSVRVGDWQIAYCGQQRLTLDHERRERYGGTDLTFLKGGLRSLLEAWDPADTRAYVAISQAVHYDEAVSAAYPALLASRRNYDVGQGRTGSGEFRSGVLEQSWRIGGASPAEVAALEAFRADARLRSVRAATHEVYALVEPPPQARVSFRGEDPHLGAMTKYSVIEGHGY